MKIIAGFTLLFLFFFPFSVKARLYDKIIAVVNGEPITLSDIGANSFIEGMSSMKLEDMDKLMKRVDEAVEYTLLLQQAKALHIDVSEKEVDATIESILRSSGMKLDQLKEVLSKEGITYESYRRMVKARLIKARILASIIKPEIVMDKSTVERFYREHVDRYREGKKRRVVQVFVPKDQKNKILKAYSLLKEGKPLSYVIRVYGDTAQADLGWVSRGELKEPLNSVIFETSVGSCSKPIESGYGYHILCVLKEKEGNPIPLSRIEKRVERDCYEALLKDKYEKWLDSLKRSSVIEIHM